MATIRVGEAIGRGLSRTGRVLFSPFRMRTWWALGLAAWLAMLGRGGGGFNFNSTRSYRSGPGGGPSPISVLEDMLRKVGEWIMIHLALVIVAGVILLVIGIALYLVMKWLSSRGEMMFLDGVVQEDFKVGKSWRANAEAGNSLFLFRVCWDIGWGVVNLALMVIAVLIAWADLRVFFSTWDYPMTMATWGAILFLVVTMLPLMVVLGFFQTMILRVMVPVMFVRKMRAWGAFKVTMVEVVKGHIGASLVFWLAMIATRIVEGLWAFVVMMILGLVTCCIFCCLAGIPIVNLAALYLLAVATLPVSVFARCFSLYFVEQMGPEYRVAWEGVQPTGFPVIMNGPEGGTGPGSFGA